MNNIEDVKLWFVGGHLKQKELIELNIPISEWIQSYGSNKGIIYSVDCSKFEHNYDVYYTKEELKKLFTSLKRKEKLKNIEREVK